MLFRETCVLSVQVFIQLRFCGSCFLLALLVLPCTAFCECSPWWILGCFVLEQRLVSGLFFMEVCFGVGWYRLDCGCFSVIHVAFLCLRESGCKSITCGVYTSPVFSRPAGENQRIQKHQRKSRFFSAQPIILFSTADHTLL